MVGAKKRTSARKRVVQKVATESAALKALRAAMDAFADIEVVEPAVKPDAVTMRAIRKAVRDFYQNSKAVERA